MMNKNLTPIKRLKLYSKHIVKLEIGFMAVLWNKMLNRFGATSQYVQKNNVNLISACSTLRSLVEFSQEVNEVHWQMRLEQVPKFLS